MKPDVPISPINKSLDVNEAALKVVFHNCSDILFRPLHVNGVVQYLLIYLDGFTNTSIMEQAIVPSLAALTVGLHEKMAESEDIAPKQAELSSFKQIFCLNEASEAILEGKTAILVHGWEHALLADINEFNQRSINEPSNEASIRGPREGFTEALRTNTSMIRRKIKSPSLKFEPFRVGTTTNTQLVIAYVEGNVRTEVLEEVKNRIGRIKTDRIFDASYIEEYIEDYPMSIFPQVLNTERPDTVAANLMEGKVAILVDGSPNALVVPMTFWAGFQSAEDHYERFLYVTAVRMVRMILVIISMLLPSLYVALTTFHPQMIPLNLMMSIAASREGIPFPTVMETFLMELMFEGLREAGLRLPKAVGSAVSIVGALVIGEAAVQAGFISAPIVMIVAGTGIASFSFPRYSLALPFRLIRFPLLLAGGVFGFYGVAMGVVMILIHLVTLKSFGVPYLKPVAPSTSNIFKDTLLRMHERLVKKNPG